MEEESERLDHREQQRRRRAKVRDHEEGFRRDLTDGLVDLGGRGAAARVDLCNGRERDAISTQSRGISHADVMRWI